MLVGGRFFNKATCYNDKKIVKYNGKIIFNSKYPDGVKVRKIDSSIMRKLGWQPKIKLKKGLIKYCEYYSNEIMPYENSS